MSWLRTAPISTVAEQLDVARPADDGMLQVVLRHLLSLELSRKTLHKHRDKLWFLGAKLIRDPH